jgi:hypothetical protein
MLKLFFSPGLASLINFKHTIPYKPESCIDLGQYLTVLQKNSFFLIKKAIDFLKDGKIGYIFKQPSVCHPGKPI